MMTAFAERLEIFPTKKVWDADNIVDLLILTFFESVLEMLICDRIQRMYMCMYLRFHVKVKVPEL